MTILDLDSVIAATGEMRPLPATTARLSSILAKVDVDLREVAKVVSLDAPLTARLLRTANSALYCGRTPITSVDQAVTRLGSGVVLSLALSATLKRELMNGLPGYGMREGELWKRSIACALAVESLKASLTRVTIPPVAFTAALLHDIGRLVLARFLDADAKDLLDRARANDDSDEETIEHHVLGVHHAELGAIIAQRWNLPGSIAHAIEHCHAPDRAMERLHNHENTEDAAQFDMVCDVVHVADAIARTIVSGDEEAIPRLSTTARTRLSCDEISLKRAIDRTKERLEQTLEMFG